MPKKKQIKVVDYRSVNLAWLVDFKDRVFGKELAPETQLVVAQEDVGTSTQFEIHQGDTLRVTGETATAYTVTRPYGDVRTGEIAKSAASPKLREEWTTEDVAEYVIKLACMADQCTYLEMIEKPKKNVSKKEYEGTFVSQARCCRFADLVGSLQHFYALKNAKISKLYVWLDIFSANQPKLTARNVEPAVRKENERQLTEGLHIAIANFEQRVMFMDKWDGAAPLTRAWCVWEIFGVAKAKKSLEIALPESEYDRFIVTLKEDYDSIITKTSAVNVQQAQCFNSADLEAIHKAIRRESSFQALDDIIKTQLRLWVASTGKLQVEKEEQKANPDLKEVSFLANQSGLAYRHQGDFTNAELLLRKALQSHKMQYGDEHQFVAVVLNNLAELFSAQGKYDEAKPIFEESLRIHRKCLGNEHPDVARSLNNIAELLRAQGKLDEAMPMHEEALAIRRKVLGNEHPYVAQSLSNLAELLREQGKLDDALKLHYEALSIEEMALGKEHPSYAIQLNNIAGLLSYLGKLDEAEPLQREALRIDKQVYGDGHPAVARDLNNLAFLLKSQGRYDEAKPMYEESLRIRRKVLGNEHPDVAQSLNNIAQLLKDQGKLEEAGAPTREALAIFKKVLGDEHPNVAILLNNLAQLLQEQGKLDDAEPLFREAMGISEKVYGKEHYDYALNLNNLAVLLWTQGKKQEARAKGKEALRIAEKVLGKDHPQTQKYRKGWG